MKTVVTGAAGFLGTAVVARLRAAGGANDQLTLVDRTLTVGAPDDCEQIVGDLTDGDLLDRALSGADRVIHLAALPGGSAEADYALSRRINLEVSLSMLDRLASRPHPARLVYASSIAVFGAPMPARVTDDTAPRPSMTYGAHKLMVETALSNLTRLGRIEGVALRLPGLVARSDADPGLKSAFMSNIFNALASRRPCTVPVAPHATMWLLSVAAAARAVVHAVHMPAPSTGACVLTLPALRVTMGDLAAAISERVGVDPKSVSYAPEPALQAMFGSLPPLSTSAADALGFRHDGDLGALVDQVLNDLKMKDEGRP